MSERRQSRMEQIVDLLAEEVAERLRAGRPAARQPGQPAQAVPVARARQPHQEEVTGARTAPVPTGGAAEATAAPKGAAVGDRAKSEPGQVPETEVLRPAGQSHAARLILRLALGMLIGVVLINLPLNRYGTTLATAMPDSQALAIRNGLVVKEEDDDEIYIYQDGTFRWISSLEAFEHRGYVWDDVHIVADGWLAPFDTSGPPIYVLLKCPESPHIYRLEGGAKRWIVDIDAFAAEGHVWEDVKIVDCHYLRGLPDGETIPPGEGPAPQP